MKNDVWENIERIFNTALNLSEKDRSIYLRQECAGDAVLFSEVESLLKSFEENSDFLNEPIFEKGLEVIEVINVKPEKDLSGSIIGYYELQEKIGAGGMGEVYKAIDIRLNRSVALKFLSESLENDNAAKRRLIKEAQAIAMLEHPNICAVHGIEQSDKHHFIVMQYIKGETLAEYITRQTGKIEEFRTLAHQIVTAVAFAHSHGVIHRDLKPGNIMLTSDGQIKVLDFGLAKVLTPQKSLRHEPADNKSLFSQNGLIIGTISYMSPEQLRGEKLNYQTDIFSLGVILYELLAMKNPFHCRTQAETIAAILNNSVAAEHISPRPPQKIVNLINKCLEKDKDKRFQSTAEILVELENAPQSEKKRFFSRNVFFARSYIILIIFFLLLVLAGFFLYAYRNRSLPTFAILPIANESNDTEVDYLSEGLTGELINKFNKFTKFKVKSLTTVSNYKGQPDDPFTVGKQLNVDMIMTGKISKLEDFLVYQVALVSTSDGSQIWHDEFKLNTTNLAKTQEDILTQVNSKFGLNLSEEEVQQLSNGQTSFPEAENQYLRGLYYLNYRDRENIDKAIIHFNKAIEIDPVYGKAYLGLSEAYLFKGSPAFGALAIKESIAKAKSAVAKALQYDGNSSEAYNTLGLIKLKYDWDWQEAEKNFVRSIELNPNYDQPYYWYSHLLIIKKDFDGALSKAEKAYELEPLAPQNEINIGRIYYYKRDNDKAIQIFSQFLEKNPSNKSARSAAYMLGLTYLQKGLYNEAIVLFENFYDGDKLYFAAPLGYSYGKLNRKNEALRILNDLETFSADGKVIAAQEKAIINLGMGNKQSAFELFSQSCADRFSSFPFVVTEFLFDDLKSDPRYTSLVKCIQPIS